MLPQSFFDQFASLGPELAWLGIAVVLDVLTGIAAAFKAGTFDAEKLPKFLADYGLLIFGWLAVEVIVRVIPLAETGIGAVIREDTGALAYAFIMLSAVSSIMKNVGELGLLGGLNKPLSRVGLGYQPKPKE